MLYTIAATVNKTRQSSAGGEGLDGLGRETGILDERSFEIRITPSTPPHESLRSACSAPSIHNNSKTRGSRGPGISIRASPHPPTHRHFHACSVGTAHSPAWDAVPGTTPLVLLPFNRCALTQMKGSPPI